MSTFEDSLKWALSYSKPIENRINGPIILLIAIAIVIALLFIWWIVLIFSNEKTPNTREELMSEYEEEYGEDEEVDSS
jgi:cytoskeletal protein RodZ